MSSAIGVIQGFHLIVAQLRSEPHWLVTDADAERYGKAMANAARHFPLKTTQKAIDVGAFLMCAFIIESPRVIRSIQLSKAPKQAPRGPAQVFQFVQPTPAQAPQSPAPSATSAAPPTGSAEGAGMPPIADGPPDLSAFGGEGA